MEAGPWRGVRDAILRLWTRRDPRDARQADKDDEKSPMSLETVTVDADAATGGRGVPVPTVSHSSLPPIPVPAPPTITGQGTSKTVSIRLRPPGETAPLEEDVETGEQQDPEANVCKAQEQLDTLIRNRGYLVKDHIPRKVLEKQVMENIRRRERIAEILRQEEGVGSAGLQGSQQVSKDPPPPQEHPERSLEMINLLTKVWSVKGATVQGRGTGDVDWARSQFVQECVSEHNRLRDLHSAPPLTLSDQLCNDAQAWANRLAHFGLLEYSSEHGRGENIMTSTAKEELTGSAVALAWYDTGRTFKYEVHGSADLAHAGPFSQVVWESTRAIGVGIARGSEGRTVVVARYWPQGNVGGQFSSNVKPPAADSTLAVIKSGTPTMSRTRQEAHFYVSIALEPPGKNKKAEKEKMAALRLPVKKVLGISGESVSGETLLTHPATIETLGTTFASCRNGAARTSKLFPICCVTPAKTEERWATPSARSQHQTQQPHQIDVATIRRTDDEIMPCSTGAKLDSGAHLSAEPSQRHKSTLRASPRLGVSPRLGTSPRLGASPRLGIASRLGSSPKMGALPKLAASARMAASPKLVATSRFGGSPKRGSPKRSMRRGASPKPGSSPRRGVNSRLRALTGTGERNVIVATL